MFQQVVFLLQFSQDFSSFGKVAKISTDSACHPGVIAVSQVSGWEPATNKFSQAGRGTDTEPAVRTAYAKPVLLSNTLELQVGHPLSHPFHSYVK